MTAHKTTLDSTTGKLAVWPTAELHPVDIEVGGNPCTVLVDVIIVDIPTHPHPEVEPNFLVCGFCFFDDDTKIRVTGISVPFLEFPRPLRDEILIELTRLAGVSGEVTAN